MAVLPAVRELFEPPVAEGGPEARERAAVVVRAPVRPGRRLELPPYDLAAALALERDLGIGHVLAQVLVRRGLTDADAVRGMLSARERHPPSAIAGLDEAVALVERHVRSGGRIVVHGDYDVDGVCATAVLVRALRSLGADPGWFIPSRRHDGYGLSAATVARLAARGPALLVTVDCGITAVEEVACARQAGLDVLVTDHHAPRADGRRPDCPTVHPGLGGYPCADLCGTAVAHKLAEALGATTVEADLELVALATVADLMPLVGENRRLVRDGLSVLAGTARPGLRALMEVSGTDPSALDAGSLGFRLAPRINAAGRMRRADAALELLLTDDPERASEIARELDLLNGERRAVEQRMGWEADALADGMGDRSAYVLAGEGWHPGVIGIVASRVAERLHRPVILVALPTAPGGGQVAPAQGSGRSIPGFDLLGALHAASGHLLRYGGHRAAAGLTVLPERVDAVRAAVESHAEQMLTADLLEPVERADAVVSAADLSLELAEELAALEPCGMGNPGINLLVTGARFESVRPMGEGRHARFTVVSGGARAAAVAFGCDGRPGGAGGEPVDASFRLERNIWQGRIEPRLVLRHAGACSPEPITVLGEEGDYLTAVLAELDRPLDEVRSSLEQAAGEGRAVLDRRGEGPLAVLADARAAAAADGSRVLAVCADVARWRPGLAERTGGFALVAHADLVDRPALAEPYRHVVALDPPASPEADATLRLGAGYTHLAWGEAELRLALQIHEREYALRASLVALYRSLRDRGSVQGEELEQLLRGGSPPRSFRLAGRLVRVLTELGLVSLDRDLPSLALASAQPTELERSRAYRFYSQYHEEGQSFLNRARHRRRT